MRARTLLFGAAAATAGATAALAFAIRPWWRSWGVDPTDAAVGFAGDDLVPDATVVETRGVEIDAPPDAVWPWLVQMGYNRAGWYSYDVVDMKGASVDRILPELQQLAVGDPMPNSPDTAFIVRSLDPGKTLVLFADEKTVEEQVAAARARKEAGEAVEETPANLKAAGKMMPAMAGFAASWAFILRPLDEGRRTRLVERFRVRMPAPEGPAAAALAGAFGFGVFAMTRKQMLGIRDRAEAAHIAAGITAEFTGRWDEKAVEAVDASAGNVADVSEATAEVATADGVADVVDATTDRVADVVDATAEQATDVVDATADRVADVVEATAEGAAADVEATAEQATDVVEATAGTVEEAVRSAGKKAPRRSTKP